MFIAMVIGFICALLNAVLGFSSASYPFTNGLGWIIASFYFLTQATKYWDKSKDV